MPGGLATGFAAGVVVTSLAGALFWSRRSRRSSAAAESSAPCDIDAENTHLYELKGDYYQMLGHAWDHEVKDFKVIYRPLYLCDAKADRFEAHYLAASHFSRWDEKFSRIDLANPSQLAQLPAAVRSVLHASGFSAPGDLVLPGWMLPPFTSPISDENAGRSGLGTRSHERHDRGSARTAKLVAAL